MKKILKSHRLANDFECKVTTFFGHTQIFGLCNEKNFVTSIIDYQRVTGVTKKKTYARVVRLLQE